MEAICHERREIWTIRAVWTIFAVEIKAEMQAGMSGAATPAVPPDTTLPEDTAARRTWAVHNGMRLCSLGAVEASQKSSIFGLVLLANCRNSRRMMENFRKSIQIKRCGSDSTANRGKR
jgi:hypothetical protein